MSYATIWDGGYTTITIMYVLCNAFEKCSNGHLQVNQRHQTMARRCEDNAKIRYKL